MASSSGPRPFLDVLVGAALVRTTALVDSGAVNGLFHVDVASEAGFDLSEAQPRDLLVGSPRESRTATFLTAGLEVGGLSWEAELGFCDWMLPDWGVLGQGAFFRWFTVTFRAYDSEFEVEPITM